MSSVTVDQAAEAVLLAHLKLTIEGCTCGWAELGRLHQTHQVAMLREAGVLRDAGDQVPVSAPR